MIRLDIEDYCQNCPEFEPDVVKYQSRMKTMFPDGKQIMIENNETTIYCEHRERCKTIKQYFIK